MYSRLGVWASLALAANCILLPPSVQNLGDDNAIETLSVNPFKQTISLECPGCAVASKKGDGLAWTENAGTSFLLDFEVGQDEETLNIDGVQLYPPSFDNFATPFYVAQTGSRNTAESNSTLRLRVTGYSFHYNSAKTVTEAGAELLPMTFKITSIESKAVAPPPLTIYLLKDVNGRLMIANFQQTTKAEESSPTEQIEEKECKDWPLLCKWKSILADKLHGAKGKGKGCHRHKSGKFNPMEHPGMHGKPPHKFRPGDHHHPHHFKHHGHGHHGHHHHNRLHRFLRRAFFTILIPILIGVFAGTLTYLIGMALGCAIAVVVTKIRGRGPYERIALEEEEDEDDGSNDSDKEVYLPVYDAPPVYEEATAEKEVVDESH